MADVYIGIDSGTQSTKTIAIDGDTGAVLAAASRAYDLIEGLPPGHKEQHPKDWIAAVTETIREVVASPNVAAENVRGIGVSGQQHGFVPLDEADAVIRPAKLWCDTSTSPQCETMIGALGGLERVIEIMGIGIPPGFTASKILWLKENEPQNYDRLACVLLPHDYINFFLTGEKVMEYGDASGTALMDVRNRVWCRDVVDAIDPALMAKLPPIKPSDGVAGLLRAEVAQDVGLSSDVIVSMGGGDNMMGAIGTGNTRSGVVTASFGTSGTIYACSEVPVIDGTAEIAAFCDSTNRWLPLLCTMNVTVATELVKDAFGMDNDGLTQAVQSVPAGSDGLVLVPYFEGERTPNVPDGTGVFFGINARTLTQAHMARAAMEGVTLGMNYGLNRMKALGIAPSRIHITGGGAKNPVWRQIMADVFDAEVVCMQSEEGAALGGAVQAKWAYMNFKGNRVRINDLAEALVKPDDSTRVTPNRKNVGVYQDLQGILDGASVSLRDIFRAHRGVIS